MRSKIQGKSIRQTNFYQCEGTELPYNMQHRNKTPADTEKEIQTKFKYPAETTANAAKIPRQRSLFIKQDQITTNLRNDSSNYNTRKTPLNYTKKKKTKTNSEQSNQSYCNFQTNLNKTTSAQN